MSRFQDLVVYYDCLMSVSDIIMLSGTIETGGGMRAAGAETRRHEDQEEASLRMFFGDRRADLDEEEATLREVSCF